ncbi:MAG: hypothetical protein ACXWDL_01340 [Nocardioides sp.]
MYEIAGTYLDYELAYKVERAQGHRAPRRAEHAKPAASRFGVTRRSSRRAR